MEETISPQTLPSFELGSRLTRSTRVCRSLTTPVTAVTLADALSAQSSPFSQHWCRYLRYAQLPEMTSSALHRTKSLNAGRSMVGVSQRRRRSMWWVGLFLRRPPPLLGRLGLCRFGLYRLGQLGLELRHSFLLFVDFISNNSNRSINLNLFFGFSDLNRSAP